MKKDVRISVIIYLITSALTTQIAGEAYEIVDKPGRITFVAAIKKNDGVCTGTIVHKDWVLTAGHCFYDDGDKVKTSDVTVIAGITNYEYPQEETGQKRKASQIKIHPSFWNGKVAKFDLALVKVDKSFEFNEYVQKIAVAGDSWPIHREVENNCMSVGFGSFFDSGSPVKTLKVWNVTAAYGKDNCPCTRRFQWRRLVCAKNADYAKLCAGDDGGPLVCGSVVRGVAHMIRNWYVCREDPSNPLPECKGSPLRGMSIYMLLCPFNDWLHGVVADIPKTPATCGAVHTDCSVVLVVILFIFHSVREEI